MFSPLNGFQMDSDLHVEMTVDMCSSMYDVFMQYVDVDSQEMGISCVNTHLEMDTTMFMD